MPGSPLRHALAADVPTPTSMPKECPAARARQDQIRVITCGSANDGKSTLIDRLLLVASLDTTTDPLACVDGTSRFFSAPCRHFVFTEASDHQRPTHKTIAAASTADVAMLLVDARLGVLEQTRRQACLASLLGIRQIALVINKMDLMGFDPKPFAKIEADFRAFACELGLESIAIVPVSALTGENIATPSPRMSWHAGPTLLGFLENVEISPPPTAPLAFAVQGVNRPPADWPGFAGTLASGEVAVGGLLRVTASGKTATVRRIVTLDGDMPAAVAGDAVTLVLDRDIDVCCGDILSHANAPLDMSDELEITLIWLHKDPPVMGHSYEFKIANQRATASLLAIESTAHVNTTARLANDLPAINDIAVCRIQLSRAVAFDTYTRSRMLGSGTLIDRASHDTVAAVLISKSLMPARHVYAQESMITRRDREILNGHEGRVIWLTGLSGAGKSTLANELERQLHARGKRTYVLDGDNLRQGINKDLGFSDADRAENIRRAAEMARLMLDAGLIVITAFISPFRNEREMARQLIGNDRFIEIFVSTPLDICQQRDPKGLYAKSRSGMIKNLTGVDSPYERPLQADLTIDTSSTVLGQSIELILALLDKDS